MQGPRSVVDILQQAENHSVTADGDGEPASKVVVVEGSDDSGDDDHDDDSNDSGGDDDDNDSEGSGE